LRKKGGGVMTTTTPTTIAHHPLFFAPECEARVRVYVLLPFKEHHLGEVIIVGKEGMIISKPPLFFLFVYVTIRLPLLVARAEF